MSLIKFPFPPQFHDVHDSGEHWKSGLNDVLTVESSKTYSIGLGGAPRDEQCAHLQYPTDLCIPRYPLALSNRTPTDRT